MRTDIQKLSQHTTEPISPTDTKQQILVLSRGQEEKAEGQSVRHDKEAQGGCSQLPPDGSGLQLFQVSCSRDALGPGPDR